MPKIISDKAYEDIRNSIFESCEETEMEYRDEYTRTDFFEIFFWDSGEDHWREEGFVLPEGKDYEIDWDDVAYEFREWYIEHVVWKPFENFKNSFVDVDEAENDVHSTTND